MHSLVPIAMVYVAAHYLTFLLFEGQSLIYLASDPLGDGWNLFGTASSAIDYSLLSQNAAWYLEVAFVVLGHVAALVLAHDRALVLYGDARLAVRSQYLGLMGSEDGGRAWTVLSRLGEADLHAMTERDGRLYAFDAVLGAVLVSGDGGRTFQQHITPQEPMVDLEIDPGDPRRVLLASARTTYRSEDGGDHWRPLARSPGARSWSTVYKP